jgi:hypothetical protein
MGTNSFRNIPVARGEPRVAGASTGTGAGTAVDDDPAAGLLTGYPGARTVHSETGGQGCEDPAAGVLTGYPGDHVHPRSHGLDDPAAGVLTGYPGARVAHSEAGGQAVDDPAAGVLTGYPGDRTAGHVATDALGIRSTGAGTSEGDAGSGHE